MKQTSQKFSSDFPFIAYLLNSNYEKSAECNPTFRQDNFFSIPKYWQVSKFTALLSEFSFPKKWGKKSKFQMVNLGNGETKDFVELWEIMHLKIWTHFSIRQTKLFWINLKHYSQRPPMLSPSKQGALQLLLYKTTTCLMRPVTFILSPKWKKPHLKQPLRNYFCKKAPP